ncbi:MAG TPA: glycosyltransferase family 2 protein [Thermoleophilaceae bacterium]|nr:glycosyltransferase family 2 protein [Thermoleophilaceae bacterium]
MVVIPAHDEEILIGEALESLGMQTRKPDEVIVVADRCGDRTAEVAAARGAAVIETVGNVHRKAGAIDQVYDLLLPRLTDDDAVLMMDADTTLSPTFISEAAKRLREPEGDGARVGGVGGIFFGCFPVKGLIGHLQNNEYVRYAREIGRRQGRSDVLTGTGTLFSVRALRDVKRARSCGELPTGTGVYDTEALTEDNELTLALKQLGYRCVSPKACVVGTRLPTTIKGLFYQRLRWQRGALENLRAYGATRQTLPYIGRQVLTYLGVALVSFYLTALTYGVLSTDSIGFALPWVAVTVFIVFERTWSVRRGGWRSIVLSGLVVPEIAYDLFLHSVYGKAATDTARDAGETWSAPSREGAPRERRLRRLRNVFAVVFYEAAAVAIIVALALACAISGVAWPLIAFLVLTFTAHAALRLAGLDPLGPILGSGENVVRDDPPATGARLQGFGGRDVQHLPPRISQPG